MAATKKSKPKLKSTKTKRPSFSAPTPPEPEEVVTNKEEEVIENEIDTPVETEPAKPTPPTKMITKEGPDKEASFDQVIKDEAPEEEEDTEDDVVEVELEDDTVEPVEESEEVSQDDSDKKGSSMFKKFLIVILILLGVLGWVMYFMTKYPDMLGGGVSLGGSEPTPTPTEAPSTPSPTPVDKSIISIEILNGAGISGAAGTTADTIEGMGYTIADTGNADNSNYLATEIYTTSDFPDELTAIFLLDLKEEFGVASISGQIDELENDANTQIILGTDWFEDETDADPIEDDAEPKDSE